VTPLPARVAEGESTALATRNGAEGSVFEDVSLEPVRSDGLPAVDGDLTPDQKKIFIDLVHKEMPLTERAHQLATLARFTDTKRAPVALRAIIEMNILDGLKDERTDEEKKMFVLPSDSNVAILVKKVDK